MYSINIMTLPNAHPSEELYRFGADGNLRLYSYDRLFYSLYGYDAGTTRTYKYSFDLNPNWVNGRLESVNFSMHNAMFYPNSYLNFNNDGYYTKHYYNGMERIASRLGEQSLSINVNDPELQDRKEWQDSLIRKNIVEITGYEFLRPGEEPDPDDPKPVFELPQVGITGLQPIGSGDVYYYHPNHLGSTCYVTDENASVVQGFLYAPFGEITNEYNNSFGNNVLPKYSFNAKELDEETGFYYYEARYYQPPTFTSRDPLFEKYPTFSPYAYCVNNPVKFIDPTGEEIVIFGENGKDKYYWDNGNVWKAQGSKREPIKDSEKLWGDLGKIIRSLNQINSTKEGKYILSKLSASSNEYRIRNEQKGDAYACYVRSEKTVYTNGHNDIGVLSHELFHAFQDLNGRGGASIYNEVEAYVFQGMVSKSLNIKDYNSGMEASPILNKEDADKYVNAMQQLVTGFNYDDFKYAIENFKEASKANYSERRYEDYDLLPNTHVLITGSLLKKIR